MTTMASSCGQVANEPACGCGQEQNIAQASGCGQAVAATASGCGQEAQAAAVSSECGQAAAASECGQAAASACGQSEVTSCGQGVSGHTPLTQDEMDAWRAFLAATSEVTAKLNRELELGAGISMHEYEILVRLSEAEDHTLRMSDLAEHVSHSRSRLTHTVGRLEKGGYVERFSCPSDGRGVNCRLTPEGQRFLGEAAPIHLAGVRRHVLDRIPEGQLAQFAALMSGLLSAE